MPSPVSSSAAAATALSRKPSQPTPYALPPTTPVSSKKKHSMPTPMMLSPAPPKAHEKQEAKVSKTQTSLKENATMGEKISATTVESGLTGTEKLTSKEEHFLKPMLPAISGIGHGKVYTYFIPFDIVDYSVIIVKGIRLMNEKLLDWIRSTKVLSNECGSLIDCMKF